MAIAAGPTGQQRAAVGLVPWTAQVGGMEKESAHVAGDLSVGSPCSSERFGRPLFLRTAPVAAAPRGDSKALAMRLRRLFAPGQLSEARASDSSKLGGWPQGAPRPSRLPK